MKIQKIFRKSKINQEDDKEIEKKLLDYISTSYPWLEFICSRKSYSTRRFDFKIKNADFATTKAEKEMATRLEIVLDADKCSVFRYKSRMIVNIPREDRDILYFGEGLGEFLKADKNPMRCYIGERDDGLPAVVDFTEIPHLLIGGTTGSGKSVCLHDIILSMTIKYTPDELGLYIIDDKNSLSVYKDLPHVKATAFSKEEISPITDKLRTLLYERKKALGSQEIDDWNSEHKEKLPHILIIFDEADTILKRGSSTTNVTSIARGIVEETAAEGRSLGIHVILASQKPTKNNIDTTIKSNLPGRIALHVTNSMDSKVILDEKGAEKLVGNGDALLKLEGDVQRIQCALTLPEERKEAIKVLEKMYK